MRDRFCRRNEEQGRTLKAGTVLPKRAITLTKEMSMLFRPALMRCSISQSS